MSAINAIYNANIYIDGNSLLGNASEFKLPEFEFGQDDFTGLGMVGTIKLPNGVEALEGEVTWNSFYPEVAKKASNPFKAVQLMVRGNLQTFNAAGLAEEVPIVTTVTAMFSKNALGGYRRRLGGLLSPGRLSQIPPFPSACNRPRRFLKTSPLP